MSDGQSEACAANGPFRRPSDTIDNAELTDFLRRVSTLGGMVQCRMAADRIEQQAARIAELEAALQRADRLCENMHHEPHEYHDGGNCPVEKWVNAALKNTDTRSE